MLTKKQQEELSALAKQKEQIAKETTKLATAKATEAKIRQEEYNLKFDAYSTLQKDAIEMNRRFNDAKSKGGKMEVTLTIQGHDDDRQKKITVDISNRVTNKNPALLSYRERIGADLIAFFRDAVAGKLQVLRQDYQNEAAEYEKKRRLNT